MEHGQLVNDYHRVLRIIKNYSLEEIDSLVKAIGSYTDMVRAGDGLQPKLEGANGELPTHHIDSSEADDRVAVGQ